MKNITKKILKKKTFKNKLSSEGVSHRDPNAQTCRCHHQGFTAGMQDVFKVALDTIPGTAAIQTMLPLNFRNLQLT